MSDMLASSSTRDESAMDLEELNEFRFSEEPSLEKM